MSPIEQLLLILTNSNIVFILLAVGVLAMQVELTHPGVWVPGFIGITCLALAIYGLGVLPVNLVRTRLHRHGFLLVPAGYQGGQLTAR